MMLIVPASNRSVPLTVVMRTLSSAPERLAEVPEKVFTLTVFAVSQIVPEQTHVFELIKNKVAVPETTSAAAFAGVIKKPVVVALETIGNDPFELYKTADAYPLVVTLPEPI